MSAIAPPEPILQIGPTAAAVPCWGPNGFRREGVVAHVVVDDLDCELVPEAHGAVRLVTSAAEHRLIHPDQIERLGCLLFRAAWLALELGGGAHADLLRGHLMADDTMLFVRFCEVGGSLRVGLFVSGPSTPHDFLPLYPIEAFGLAFRLWRMASPPEAEAADAAQEAA